MRDRVAWSCAALAGVLHLAVADRYDLFRDELYFIVCGLHPAAGYADQPSLVPLLAAALYHLGAQTWLVRLPAVLAAAALAWLVVRFARLLGARDGAAWLAGIAVGVAPMLAGLSATLNTTTFEPLAWTAIAYALARLAILGDRRAPLWAGAIGGIAMQAKYALPLWLIALALGLALTSERRVLRSPQLWIGVSLAAALALPSVVWQAAHGWPFVELVRNAHLKDVAVSPAAFALNQLLVFNPGFAPLWIGGFVAPFVVRDLRCVRFVAIAYLVTAVAIVVQHGKDYYLAPAVPSLFAIGAVACERVLRHRALFAGYAAVSIASALPLLPIALPILDPPSQIAYQQAMHLARQEQEHGDATDGLPSLFADMLGWHAFVREVGDAYAKIPIAERTSTALVVDNYGEAAAIDVYGRPYDLPRALSGHNQYFFWGPVPDAEARNLLRVRDADAGSLAPYCRKVRVLGTTAMRFARPFEKGKAIVYCEGLHPALSTIWPALKRMI